MHSWVVGHLVESRVMPHPVRGVPDSWCARVCDQRLDPSTWGNETDQHKENKLFFKPT